MRFKPDFDECSARIPVRFRHHNIEYEKHRTVKGHWKTPEERWLDVDAAFFCL